MTLASTLQVGGAFWDAQPELPAPGYTLVRVRDPGLRKASIPGDEPVVEWLAGPAAPSTDHARVPSGCDPWHLLRGAGRLIVDGDDPNALVAALAGVPVTAIGQGRFEALGSGTESAADEAFRATVADAYVDPFTGERMLLRDAIALCGFWRRLIDSNRDISAAIGFAFWKRPTVAPLLWAGSPVPFLSSLDEASEQDWVAVWKSRTRGSSLARLERSGARMIEVEDGFIRSAGLGADCVPPLSIVVDRLGAYFDPGQPSELEELLQKADFSSEELERAQRLRTLIIDSGLTKYASARSELQRRGGKRHILVPGQVEDDRSVIAGGGGIEGNLDLLRRVRADAPDAYILYKPHPDVEAGHRAGRIDDRLCLSVADELVRDEPMSALLDLVDEVHVNTSLAGFEALVREKPVTTHGVPFYAGWGLTRDLGPVPKRRSRRRGLDELVAATLLHYPRYLDPVTGLPCPAEILVRRLAEPAPDRPDNLLVRLRKLQGRCMRGIEAVRSSLVDA